jgi:hypothetical protein
MLEVKSLVFRHRKLNPVVSPKPVTLALIAVMVGVENPLDLRDAEVAEQTQDMSLAKINKDGRTA